MRTLYELYLAGYRVRFGPGWKFEMWRNTFVRLEAIDNA